MSSLLQLLLMRLAVGAGAILILGLACYTTGLRINTTRSIPVGLYRVSSKPVEVGDYVLFCPPPLGVFDVAKARGYIGAGFCPGHYGYMMKRVLAAKDDEVSVADEGVRVNGRMLPFSAVLPKDKGGRSLPRYQAGRYALNAHQVLLMTDSNPLSFDSRYFGPINRAQIKTVIVPVMTW